MMAASANGIAAHTNVSVGFELLIVPPDDPHAYSMANPCTEGDERISGNCYHAATGTLNFGHCRLFGYKNVQAEKTWQGRAALDFGFGCKPATFNPADPNCVYGPIVSVEPSGTRYLMATITVHYVATSPVEGSPYTVEATIQAMGSVDRYSGLISTDYAEELNANMAADTELTDRIRSVKGYKVSIACGKWNSAWLPGESTMDVPVGTVTAEGLTVMANSISEASAEWSAEYTSPEGDPLGPRHVLEEVTIALSNPYPAAELYADGIALLNWWNLSDHVQYPWRDDAQCVIAPLVTYNEVIDPIDLLAACAFATHDHPNYDDSANAALYDGSIFGKPLPHGYGRHFDPRHITWANSNPVSWDMEVGAWTGGSSIYGADLYMPAAATQWTEALNGMNCPPGGYVILVPSNPVGIYSPRLRMQKWAETLEKFPSINYEGPEGDTGSPWFDDQSKGDYLEIQRYYNMRDWGEVSRYNADLAYCRAVGTCGTIPDDATPIRADQMDPSIESIVCSSRCHRFTPCAPAVACYSPNGETWPNGVTYDFPASGWFTGDSLYGNQWLGQITQAIPNPWEIQECDEFGPIPRLMVEARCSLPVDFGEGECPDRTTPDGSKGVDCVGGPTTVTKAMSAVLAAYVDLSSAAGARGCSPRSGCNNFTSDNCPGWNASDLGGVGCPNWWDTNPPSQAQ